MESESLIEWGLEIPRDYIVGRRVSMKYENYEIRMLKKEEEDVLGDFLYEAIFQKDDSNPAPRDIIYKPELKVYIENFGQEDDNCLVAEYEGQIVGAVWTRIIKGYGSVDDKTPELAISLYKEYRGKGIGTNMMLEMLEVLKEKGYHQASLSVQKDNYASQLYIKVGFEVVKELEDEYVMVYKI